jgi:hypothetical protein
MNLYEATHMPGEYKDELQRNRGLLTIKSSFDERLSDNCSLASSL